MFCYKCGSPVKDGELFCSACGARQGEPAQGGQPAQQPMQPPYGQQPVQPPYGQPCGQPVQPPYGQPPKKKSKKFLWIGIAAALVLAIAAVAVFVVLPAMGGGGPLSGNTVQTKFINDNVKVFSGAFSGIGNDTFEKLLKEPFDISVDLTSDIGGKKVKATVEAAYDKKSLGFSAESGGVVAARLLLLEDTLFTESGGNVTGLKFVSETDLSKSMALSDRIKAIAEGLTDSKGKAKLDYKKLAELFVNSISADCFESSGSVTTLTLTPGDITDAFKTFTDKLGKDKGLKQELEDFIKDVSGTTVDIEQVLSTAVEAMEATKDTADFELVWELVYEGGVPASLEFTVNSGEDSVKLKFAYSKRDGGKDITFAMHTQEDSAGVTGAISYKKTSGGIEYSGSITVAGSALKFDGSEKWSGDNVEGEVNVSVPGSGDYRLEYEESIKFGMPPGIENDDRFSMDTAGADVTDISSLLDYFTLAGGSLGPVALDPEPFEIPSVSEGPAVSQQPSATNQIGLIIPNTDDGYYKELASAIETELSYYGEELTVVTTNYDAAAEKTQFSLMLAQGMGGIVIVPMADNAALASMQSEAGAAGVPVVVLSDFPDGSYDAVSRHYEEAAATLADYCSGNVYVISAMQELQFSAVLEEGLTAALGPEASVLGTGYSQFNSEEAAKLATAALGDHPDLSTVVCLDPSCAQAVLDTLNSNGFAGTLICLVEEDIMNEMTTAAPGSTYVTYMYFPVSDAAYNAVSRIYEIKGGDNVPQTHYLDPYTY